LRDAKKKLVARISPGIHFHFSSAHKKSDRFIYPILEENAAQFLPGIRDGTIIPDIHTIVFIH